MKAIEIIQTCDHRIHAAAALPIHRGERRYRRATALRAAAVRRLHLGAQLALILRGERGVVVETVSA